MSKNTSISLGDHFVDFIHKEIESGKYNSTSEVIQAALRLLQKQEEREENLRKALEEGEQSEVIEQFNADHYLQKLKNKHR